MGRSADLSFAQTSKPSVRDIATIGGFRNKIINGNFDFWQRTISQTSDGYGADDRWFNGRNGSTHLVTRQDFALGQTDVPGYPTYFSRTVVTSVAGVNNYTTKIQRIEGVSTLSGKKATFTFYAKADAPKNMAIEFYQDFSTGGSPSPGLTVAVSTVNLTTSWKRYDIVVDIPSVSGKTLGTLGNDSLRAYFWFEAGTNFASRTNSIGHQSGTFDIAHVSLVEGDATAEADPFTARSYQEEFALCCRYYQAVIVSGLSGSTYVPNGDTRSYVKLNYRIRGTPAYTVTPPNLVVIASGDLGAIVNGDLGNMTLAVLGSDGIRIQTVANPGVLASASANVVSWGASTVHAFRADAEL